jgi:hypothetical protein
VSDSSLAKKLQIKSGFRVTILNAPQEYQQLLGELPSGAQLVTRVEPPLDFAQVFVKTNQELEAQVPAILKALKKDGLFWVSYPKGGSKIKTDLNRDILWESMGRFRMVGVSLISIDGAWSAMRFRPGDKVGKK